MSKKIMVPATSANLGCGFDSLGIAVNRYLEIELVKPLDHWFLEHDLGADIPNDEQNLIIKTALSVVTDLKPYHLKMTSQIPLEHGLGSSSSAIVAGIKLALLLSDVKLTIAEQLALACDMEGHPDNVVPALLGGLQVASYDEEKNLDFVSLPQPECQMIAFVPDYSLSTKAARSVLPKAYKKSDAVLASSKANVLIASLSTSDLVLAGKMMESDLFHEKYRASLIPELEAIRALGHEHHAFATYLSGAGSTIMTWISQNNSSSFIDALKEFQHSHNGDILTLTVDPYGARIV